MSHYHMMRAVGTPKVKLHIAWAYDDQIPYDISTETMEALARGDLTTYVYRVSVALNGVEVAETYIAGCLYSTPEEGLVNRISGYLRDMVAEVCDEAREYAATMPKLRVKL